MTVVYSIGHSNRPWEEFVDMLKLNDVKVVADIRSAPGSHRNPQFGKEKMLYALAEEQIIYLTFKVGLGGHRRCAEENRHDEVSGAWKNRSFGDYAEWMQTQTYADGRDALLRAARVVPTAIMCSEAVPWRCHRSMVTDDLILAQNCEVIDLIQTKSHGSTASPHAFARVSDAGTIVYPKEEE